MSIARWPRPEGGTLTVYANAQGSVVQIDFDARQGQLGRVDLPCARDFGIEGSHVNLDFAARDSQVCMRESVVEEVYSLKDRSDFEAWFYGANDGSLERATWYRYAMQETGPTPAPLKSPWPCRVPTHEARVLRAVRPTVSRADIEKAMAAGAKMVVEVRVLLAPDAKVAQATMYSSSGSVELDDAAIAAVQMSSYAPKEVYCQPVYSVYRFPFSFAPASQSSPTP